MNNSSGMRRIAGNTLIAIGGLILAASATAKFAQVPQVVAQLNSFGFEGRIRLLAAGELTTAILFLVPATRSAGLLLVSSFMGGVIATHMQHGESYLMPSVLLALFWVGAGLRHPEVAWSLNHPPAIRSQVEAAAGPALKAGAN
jgi:hypothetical protein